MTTATCPKKSPVREVMGIRLMEKDMS